MKLNNTMCTIHGYSLYIGHTPGSKVHGVNMGPTWERQDPGGPYVGPMNLTIWDGIVNISVGTR